MTHGNIIGANVIIHYHDNAPIQFNDVYVHNNQNDIFIREPIDVYVLEVYNPKRSLLITIESLSFKKYKEPLHPLLCIFILFYFLALLEAMSESVVDKLKRKARGRELEKKVEATRREQVERKRPK